jgi:hypothetical protein
VFVAVEFPRGIPALHEPAAKLREEHAALIQLEDGPEDLHNPPGAARILVSCKIEVLK